MAPKERIYAWDTWFDAPPARVWPVVADTNRVDRLAGLPAATYAPAGAGALPGALRVRQTFYGLLPVAYEEEPYEWVEADRFSVTRRFERGPVTSFSIRTQLVPENRGTRMLTEIRATPRSALSALAVPFLVRRARRGLEGAYRALERELVDGGEGRDDHGPGKERRAVARRVRDRLARDGGAAGGAAGEVVARLATHLATADGADLRRVRPYALADRWGASRPTVLETFLVAVRAGVLDLSWESLCPHCRGTTRSARSLAEVRAGSRCEACGVDYDVEFDHSLEAVFRPAADLRRVGAEVYCLGGPRNTPHVLAQRRIAPGATVTLALDLAPGAYRVRAAKHPAAAVLHAATGATLPAATTVALHADGARVGASTVAAGAVRLDVTNADGRDVVAVVERTAWLDDVATALDVVALPGYADLFTADVLAPGERIAVRRVTILFSDLRGSTALYRRVGDAAAYALVRDHFRAVRAAIRAHHGMFVKTIGDAVMASFRTPAAAVAAAVDMHRAVGRLAVPAGCDPLVLKTGVHEGPSIVVNAGGLLDFFGTTTNLAARAQHEARGGDVILSAAVAADEDVARVLADVPHAAEAFDATLKGFDAPIPLRRVTWT